MKKTCSQCNKELPATLDHFYASGRYNGGLSQPCKKCARAAWKIQSEKKRRERGPTVPKLRSSPVRPSVNDIIKRIKRDKKVIHSLDIQAGKADRMLNKAN